jgi:hypothetical protein
MSKQLSTGWKAAIALASLILAFILWMIFVTDAP